jgi:GNAT superfamily N-acetyltransferase
MDERENRWRAMTRADLPRVTALADAVHLGHPERPEVFAERLALFAAGSLVLADAADRVVGYAVAHPWGAGIPPLLDTLLGALPEAAEVLHLHDLVVAPEARGAGASGVAIRRLATVALDRRLFRLTLVAVDGADRLWRRTGFDPTEGMPVAPIRASYGADAIAMTAPAARFVG